ncbi:MAG: tRNA uridine-5-carboxymethylaminomethyl(34) synthesis GTPase MnmE [Gallionella sp.]|nr:tRNA uridine-5-carboxymethylaminomethyl(34) synthesis GTPase MnmE [Gallionella sp.]
MPSNADTIVAIATAQGRGGVGVVRISGCRVKELACAILGKLPPARYATYTAFFDQDGEILDQGIALYFSAPHSYTGEDVLELQGHGGAAVLQLLLQRCLALGVRLAQPGEFTRRAYLNDKLDLAQAESVADLIEANTAQAARSAMRSLRGEFSAAVRELVDELIGLRMLVEAMLDFPEEELDSGDVTQREIRLKNILLKLQHTQDAAKQGSLLREGMHITIAGRPNVGKSSLLNRLSGEEVALVSDIPGTTRDVIRQTIQISGVPVHVMDTAGLRDTQDKVEEMGIARARDAMHRADLVLLLVDLGQGVSAEDEAVFASLPQDVPRLLVFNKADLPEGPVIPYFVECPSVRVSAKTGAGLDDLRGKMLEMVGWRDQDGGIFMARERHLKALSVAMEHLFAAQSQLAFSELFAEELRLSQRALNEILGEFSSDDLLGEIFSRFCIGK